MKSRRGRKRSLSTINKAKELERDLPIYPAIKKPLIYEEPAEKSREKDMAIMYQREVDIQRSSVFYFEKKQAIHVKRYSDRNVLKNTERKFPQFVTSLKDVREYIPPELQIVMTNGSDIADEVKQWKKKQKTEVSGATKAQKITEDDEESETEIQQQLDSDQEYNLVRGESDSEEDFNDYAQQYDLDDDDTVDVDDVDS